MSDLKALWQQALDVWGINVRLSEPVAFRPGQDGHWGGGDPLAYIDLRTRQVVVNTELLDEIGASGSLGAVLAHEVGHHVAFPHTLGLSARLHVLQNRLLPEVRQPLTNLFFDLLVNEVVGRTQAKELAAVYQGFVARSPKLNPVFAFYLALYEELWSLTPGTLVPKETRSRVVRAYPGFQSEARIFVQTFYALDDLYLQFVYFCSRFARYLYEDLDGSEDQGTLPLAGDVEQPGADDYAGALRRDPRAEQAVSKAIASGWLEEDDTPSGSGDPLKDLGKVLAGLPGSGAGELRQAVASRIYRSLVDRYLLDLPVMEAPEAADPSLPTTLLPWEVGDDPRGIDWIQSVIASGPLAGVRPLQRDTEVDTEGREAGEVVALDVFLDTSGSMPNPTLGVNAMTLAAQILSASALRQQGRVRGVIYSASTPHVSPYMYDEETARDFFLRFIGGGTQFPFEVLERFCEEPGAIRVLISDFDFSWNLERSEIGTRVLKEACAASHSVVFLLRIGKGHDAKLLELLDPILSAHSNAHFVPVRSTGDLAAAAARLARALLP